MATNSTCTGILPNPDISGIGIRVSLYITALLLAIVPRVPGTGPLVNALATNAGVNGLAVLITAIVQTAQDSLDLYHAIFILHLLTLVGISASPAGLYKWNGIRVALVSMLSILALLMGVIFAFYVWVNAPTFGSQPECNSQVKYVIMFFTVDATSTWLRILWMVGLGSVCLLISLLPLVMLCVYKLSKREDSKYHAVAGHSKEDAANYNGIIARVGSAVMGIILLELTVKANNVPDENIWSFGQILAVVLLFSSLNEFLHAILEHFD